MLTTALLVWSMNQHWYLLQHYRFDSWTDSVGLLHTAGLSHEPTLLKQPLLSVGTTNWQCCSTGHCRVEPGTDTVSYRSVSVFKDRQWCQSPITAGMSLLVQNPAMKWVFEPAVMSRSGVVSVYLFIKNIFLNLFGNLGIKLYTMFHMCWVDLYGDKMLIDLLITMSCVAIRFKLDSVPCMNT